MDVIQHGTQSIIVTDLFYATIFGHSIVISSPWVSVIFFLIGTIPDISGWIDGKIRGEKYRWDGTYKFFHKDLSTKKNMLLTFAMILVLPGLMYHIFTDLLFHKPEGGWYNSGWIWNIVSWIITLWVGYVVYFHVF